MGGFQTRVTEAGRAPAVCLRARSDPASPAAAAGRALLPLGSALPVGLTGSQAVPVQQPRAWHLRARSPPGQEHLLRAWSQQTSQQGQLHARARFLWLPITNYLHPVAGTTRDNRNVVPRGPGGQNSRPACRQDPLAPETVGENRACVVQLLGPSMPLASLGRGHVPPISVFTFRHLLLSVCLISPVYPL